MPTELDLPTPTPTPTPTAAPPALPSSEPLAQCGAPLPDGALSRLGAGKGNVDHVDYSSDGRYVAIGGDRGLCVYSMDTFEEIWFRPVEHGMWLWTAGFSPDGSMLAAKLDDFTTVLWDAQTGEAVQLLQSSVEIRYTGMWSPDGTHFARWRKRDAHNDPHFIVWDVRSGETSYDLNLGSFDTVTWSPDGTQIIVYSEPRDRGFTWVDAVTGQIVRTQDDNYRVRYSLTWSPDSTTLAWVEGGNVVIADALTGDSLLTLETDFAGESHVMGWNLGWTPDGELFIASMCKYITGGTDRRVHVWDAETGERVLTLIDTVEGIWSPDGSLLAAGSSTGTIEIWDVAAQAVVHNWEDFNDWVMDMFWSQPAAASSPHSDRLLSWSRDGDVILWDINTGQAEWQSEGHLNDVEDLAWSPDGTRIITVSNSAWATIWDTQTGQMLQTLETPRRPAGSSGGHCLKLVDWSPDGRRIAAGNCNYPAVFVWDASTGTLLHTLVRQAKYGTIFDSARDVAFSPGGARLAVAYGGNEILVWDVETAELLMTGARSGEEITWSPDGTRLAVGDGKVVVWNVEAGTPLFTLPPGATTSWSPDSTRLADMSGEIMWDMGTGEAVPAAACGGGLSAAWSPIDDSLLAWIRENNTVTVCNVETGETVYTSQVFPSPLSDIQWLPDGTLYAATSEYGVVIIWECS